MKVLVTGGLGFIGRAVTLTLLRAGHDVDVLTRGRTVGSAPGGAAVVEGDIRDRDAMVAVLRTGAYDGLCHLAALTNPRESIGDPLTYWDVNVAGTLNLLRAAADAPDPRRAPTRFVLASTNIAYGTQLDGAVREDTRPSPESPYARSKVAAEQLVDDVARTGALHATTLRIFNAAGAVDGHGDTDRGRLIPNVLRAAMGELAEVSVNGDGSVVRDYAHVADLATAFQLALEAASDTPRTYNVGTGVGTSVNEIIAAAARVTGRTIAVRRLPPKPEPHTLIADSSSIRNELGWTTPHSALDNIIRSAWNAATRTS